MAVVAFCPQWTGFIVCRPSIILVKHGVRRQIDRVNPVAIGGNCAVIVDRPRDVDQVAYVGVGWTPCGHEM